MNDQEKHDQTIAFKKKYGKRPGFKRLFNRMQRSLYRDDVLQPFEANYKQRWYQAWKDREAIYAAVEREEERKARELDASYRSKPKGVITYEEKILRDVRKEHPKMVSEEDIIKLSQ